MLEKIEISKSTLTRNLFLGITILIGAASGILIGYQIIAKNEVSAISRNVSGVSGVPEKMQLKFGKGELFPAGDFRSLNYSGGNFSTLFNGKRSGVIFSELGCPACSDFFEQWSQIVTAKLKEGVQEVVIMSINDTSAIGEYKNYLDGKKICLIDMDAFKKQYNLLISPTVLALDESGVVQHIQYGMRDGIDFEILKFLTTHDI